MCTAGTHPQIAAPADATSAPPFQRSERSSTLATPRIGDTLHCSSDVPGSAAQFNQSVSAMPCNRSIRIDAQLQGTADTLFIGWAA